MVWKSLNARAHKRTCVDANAICKSSTRNTHVWIALIQTNPDSCEGIFLSNRHGEKWGHKRKRSDNSCKWNYVTTQMEDQVRVKKRVKICLFVCVDSCVFSGKPNLNWEIFKLYFEMFSLLSLLIFFYISVVVVDVKTKTFLKTKLLFVKLHFLAGKIQERLKKNFKNVSKISVICSLRLTKNQ